MAKAETTIVEVFEIRARVTAEQMGPAVASLNRLGLSDVSFELITETHSYAQKTRHEIKAEEFLAVWVADHPTFKASDAVTHFKADGRADGACYNALRILCEKKILKKLSAGNYARADVKQITAPKKVAAPKKVERERNEVDHREFILRYARQHHGRMSTAKLRVHFDLHGRKPTSVGGALNVLLKKKMIKSLGDGEYELRAKPETKEKAKPIVDATAPLLLKLNGSEAHVEVLTNG